MLKWFGATINGSGGKSPFQEQEYSVGEQLIAQQLPMIMIYPEHQLADRSPQPFFVIFYQVKYFFVVLAGFRPDLTEVAAFKVQPLLPLRHNAYCQSTSVR